MRILLVEDDESVSAAIAQFLTHQNYIVDTANDGVAGLDLVDAFPYDLILLDVMLPKLDGITVCKRLRTQNTQIPILMLTARDTSTDKVKGLDAGADDYLVKPVDLPELGARVRTLLRRSSVSALPPVLQWGNLHLNPSSCEVDYEGQIVPLTKKEFMLMELFMRNPRMVFSRSAILEHLWAFDDPPSEDTIKAHIKGIRQKLKATGLKGDCIETVYGQGYRLNPATPSKPLVASNTSPEQDSYNQTDQNKAQKTKAAMAQLWQRFKHTNWQRVTTLQEAALAYQSSRITEVQQQQALQAAHKLAGSLGTFGFIEGSRLARQIEYLLDTENLLERSQQEQFVSLVDSLHSYLEAESPTIESNVNSGAELTHSFSNRPKLLIVDVDRELIENINIEAATWGIQTEVAYDIDSARQLITQNRPDIVLLDLSFPNATREDLTGQTDSLNLLSELASLTPPIPVITFTASYGFTDRVTVAKLGGRAFLAKPVAPSLILETVTQIVQRDRPSKTKILAVDDDPLMLKMLTKLLEPWNIKVITLSEPSRFWDVLEATTPDLLVLDVNMPDFDGIELCQVVRNDQRWSWLPVLFLTAVTDTPTIHSLFAAGADDYVSKPIAGPELIARISNRLERNKVLRTMAETDALTGVANRRKSTQDFNRLIRLAERQGQPFCLGILDIDSFKTINDRYGHAMGDRVLYRFGELLRQTFRSEDIIARWGGEEFIVGMYGMSKADGIERLAEMLETLRDEEFSSLNHNDIKVTFSAGVAQYPQDGQDLQTLYQAADSALYQAKLAGRDRVLPTGWQPATTTTHSLVPLESNHSTDLPTAALDSADAVNSTPPVALNTTTDVFLIHPEPTFASALLRALETRGYHALWVETGQAGLDTITNRFPNLQVKVVILYNNMPDIDGLTLLKRLNTAKVTASTRVITIVPPGTDTAKILKLGAFDYVVTPCSIPVVMQRLRHAL